MRITPIVLNEGGGELQKLGFAYCCPGWSLGVCEILSGCCVNGCKCFLSSLFDVYSAHYYLCFIYSLAFIGLRETFALISLIYAVYVCFI